jgi:hypothetical protein
MESLLSCLANLERKLKEDGEMQVTEEYWGTIAGRVVDSVGVGTSEPTGVALAPVHTYVHQLDKTPTGWPPRSIAVPPFACHWGIVVGEPDDQRLLHLVFAEGAIAEAQTSTVANKFIRFHDSVLEEPLANTEYVGKTRYNTDELHRIGLAMIREFGNYHRVFWNCQMFAKCYLRVITGEPEADFSNWTSADTSRLFLCAFLVGSPVATTSKMKETRQAETLVRKFESIPEHLPTEEKSAQAIMAIYESLKQDPSWGSEVGKLEDTTARPGFLDQLLKRLFGSYHR